MKRPLDKQALAFGVVAGTGIGALSGLLIGHFLLGLGVGVALGLAFGLVLSALFNGINQ
ncbi:MAG: hypothetical protein M3Z04_03935 [Chloroflexota bacterium]|nr:hypothetical protein [Chloroflexota bacterium]